MSVNLTARINNRFAKVSEDAIYGGLFWYKDANKFAQELSNSNGISVETASAVIAHLSPRVPWSRNKNMARELVETGTTKGLNAAIKRAVSAIESDSPLDTINGPKTRAFAQNINGNENAVTIDVWMLRLIFPEMNNKDRINWLGRKGNYEKLEQSFNRAAKRVGITPAQMQAILWCEIRGNAA